MRTRGLLLLVVLTVLLTPGLLHAQTVANVDFSGNGTVDFTDFILFAQAYYSTQVRFDLNRNGTVDLADFLLFAQAFDRETNPKKNTLTVALPGHANMDLVYIPPGTFRMGSPKNEKERDNSDEGPQHEVKISNGFYLGKYEVTQKQWEAVMGTTPWSKQNYVQVSPDNPAVYISWNDAQEFVHKLNVAEGDSLYRLPTEAEWEYACRAGTTTRWSFGENETLLSDHAWYFDNAWNREEQYVHTAGIKKPSAWGLYDMHGNAWEWCQDWYGLYSDDAFTDPQGPPSGPGRIVRSGAFSFFSRYTRSAYRSYFSPDLRSFDLGFRLLRRAN
ncbi:MAG: SUMF1/EgtB/PvdO family nonheme iron enzyme [bacterium]|nr:SUMF1/EgtB/PvdO family nonheme iron enzyme [bacterium]